MAKFTTIFILTTILLCIYCGAYSQDRNTDPLPNYQGKNLETNQAVYAFLEKQPKNSRSFVLKGYYYDESAQEGIFLIGRQSIQDGALELRMYNADRERVGFLTGRLDSQGILKGSQLDKRRNTLFKLVLYPKEYPGIL